MQSYRCLSMIILQCYVNLPTPAPINKRKAPLLASVGDEPYTYKVAVSLKESLEQGHPQKIEELVKALCLARN